jgi:hypothetical protein
MNLAMHELYNTMEEQITMKDDKTLMACHRQATISNERARPGRKKCPYLVKDARII